MSNQQSKQNTVSLTSEDISYLEGLLEAYRMHMEIDKSNEEAVKRREIEKVEELEQKLAGTEE